MNIRMISEIDLALIEIFKTFRAVGCRPTIIII